VSPRYVAQLWFHLIGEVFHYAHDMDIGCISSGAACRAGARPNDRLEQPSANGGAEARTARSLKQEDVSQIKGATVYGGDNKKIGSIATVLMRPDSHQIDRLVVGAGGVLGVGAHDVALPVDQFRWDSATGGFKIKKTEADLKAMPVWVASGADKGMNGSSAPPPAPATNR
jgi:PRC-barrel domain protein